MSLMGMLFGSSEEEEIRNEEGVILKPIRVLNAKGEKIATVTAEESLSIVQEKEQGQIRLIQLNERHEEIKSLMSCPYAQNADARKELTDMMAEVKRISAMPIWPGKKAFAFRKANMSFLSI